MRPVGESWSCALVMLRCEPNPNWFVVVGRLPNWFVAVADAAAPEAPNWLVLMEADAPWLPNWLVAVELIALWVPAVGALVLVLAVPPEMLLLCVAEAPTPVV